MWWIKHLCAYSPWREDEDEAKKNTCWGIVIGVLILLFIIIGPMAPLWSRLGVEPFCIQGEWPHLQFVSCSVTSSLIRPLPTRILQPEGSTPIRSSWTMMVVRMARLLCYTSWEIHALMFRRWLYRTEKPTPTFLQSTSCYFLQDWAGQISPLELASQSHWRTKHISGSVAASQR